MTPLGFLWFSRGELSPEFQGFVSGRMVMTIKEEGSTVEKMTSRKGDDFHFRQTNARIDLAKGWLSPGRKNQKNRRKVKAKVGVSANWGLWGDRDSR